MGCRKRLLLWQRQRLGEQHMQGMKEEEEEEEVEEPRKRTTMTKRRRMKRNSKEEEGELTRLKQKHRL
jgi:hypothetical protein